jgi:hypothetical protein
MEICRVNCNMWIKFRSEQPTQKKSLMYVGLHVVCDICHHFFTYQDKWIGRCQQVAWPYVPPFQHFTKIFTFHCNMCYIMRHFLSLVREKSFSK